MHQYLLLKFISFQNYSFLTSIRMPTYQAYKCINTTARMDCFEDWVTQTRVFLNGGDGGSPLPPENYPS